MWEKVIMSTIYTNEWLKEREYDGLYCEDCACKIGDFHVPDKLQ